MLVLCAIILFQCLEVIAGAMRDAHIHDSRKLSLLQRARKICSSKENATKSTKQNKKAAGIGKRCRPSSNTSVDVVLSNGIEDFQNMDVLEAPEVGNDC